MPLGTALAAFSGRAGELWWLLAVEGCLRLSCYRGRASGSWQRSIVRRAAHRGLARSRLRACVCYPITRNVTARAGIATWVRVLGPEILTMQHEIERAGMAEIALANRRLQPLGHLSGAENPYRSGACRSSSRNEAGNQCREPKFASTNAARVCQLPGTPAKLRPMSGRSSGLEPGAGGALRLGDLGLRHLVGDLAAQAVASALPRMAARLNHLCADTSSIGTLRPTETHRRRKSSARGGRRWQRNFYP